MKYLLSCIQQVVLLQGQSLNTWCTIKRSNTLSSVMSFTEFTAVLKVKRGLLCRGGYLFVKESQIYVRKIRREKIQTVAFVKPLKTYGPTF